MRLCIWRYFNGLVGTGHGQRWALHGRHKEHGDRMYMDGLGYINLGLMATEASEPDLWWDGLRYHS